MSPRLRLSISIIAVLMVFLVGTTGYLYIDDDRHVGFADAAYMTVITLSTVGFTEVWPLSPNARLWTIGVITFGIATVSYALTSLVALIVSGELRQLREMQRMEKTIDNLSDHVIVCGFGRIGVLVAEDLKKCGTPLVVIESQRNLEFDLREMHVPYVLGDATDEATLLHAGLMRARALVVGLPSDADVVYVTLTARTLNPKLTIIARAEQPSTESKLHRAGASRVVCPHVIGASRVVNILTRPNVVELLDVAARGVDLELDEYNVPADSPLIGRSLADADVQRKSGAMVVAIKRADGETLTTPEPITLIAAQDTMILVGPVGASTRLGRLETPM